MQGILFTDVETVPATNPFIQEHVPPVNYFDRFAAKVEGEAPEFKKHYEQNAALYAEHCQIVSIALGVLIGDKFYARAYTSRDEKKILVDTAPKFNEYKIIAGHNIKEFDCPILMRRFLANGLPLPGILNPMFKKPWDVDYHDTMIMWSGSQWNYRVSQDLLAKTLGVPSSKSEMSGADVSKIYWGMFDGLESSELPFEKEKEALDKIGSYNIGDIVTNARIYAKLRGLPVFKDEQIQILTA